MTALSIGLSGPVRADATPGAAPLLAAASFAAVTQALIVPGLLPGLADGLAVGVAEAGQASTSFALAAALGALPAARLCRHLPQDRLVAGGLAGLAVLSAAAALATSFPALLVLRAFGGLLAAAVLPAAPALAAALAGPAGRVRALAAVTSGTTLAFAAGLPATSLVAEALGWRAAFVLAGLFCAAAALVLAIRLPAAAPAPPAGDPGHAGAVLPSPRAIGATLLLVLLALASVFATQASLGPIAAVALHASPAVLQALVAAGALLGVPAGAALAERRPDRAAGAIALCLLLAALWQWGLLAGGPHAQPLHSPLLQAGQVVFASGALFAVSPVLQARLLAAAGRAGTMAMAANFVAVSLGQALGAALGGLAMGRAGLAGAAAIGVMAAGLMLILAVRPAR